MSFFIGILGEDCPSWLEDGRILNPESSCPYIMDARAREYHISVRMSMGFVDFSWLPFSTQIQCLGQHDGKKNACPPR